MGRNSYPDTIDQAPLFPPSLHDWLPEGHLARFLVDVVSALDLSEIYKSRSLKDGRGQAAYAQEMMVRLLLYGYVSGVYSSRRIQSRTYEDLTFRYLSGDQHPDHATIAEFRKRHPALYPTKDIAPHVSRRRAQLWRIPRHDPRAASARWLACPLQA